MYMPLNVNKNILELALYIIMLVSIINIQKYADCVLS